MKETSKARQFDFPVYDEIDDSMTDITAMYLRVSTDMQAQEGYGLDFQYAAIKKYCQAFDIPNIVVFVDDGYTGMNEDRPAFQKMNALMKQGRVKFVITYSLDRIGRTQMIILKFLKERCEQYKCDFYAVKDNVDSRSKQTYGILISILSIFAEFDHDAIIAKLTSGRRQRALDGYWKGGGIPPYGYRYSKELNNLEVIPEQAVQVEKIFEMYTTMQYSPYKISQILGLSGDGIVFNILRNRTYLGEIQFQGERYKGRHQRLIDDDTFYLAQEILKNKSVVHGDSTYLLTSKVYCGNCGAKMRYMKWGKGRSQRIKLICYSRTEKSSKPYLVKDPNCPNETYDATLVENEVVNAIMSFAVKYSDERKERKYSGEDIVEGLEKQKAKLETEYSRLLTAYKKLGDEEVLELASETKKEIKRIELDISNENEKRTISKRLDDKIDVLRTLPDTWKKMDATQKQNIIRGLVDKIIITDGVIQVYLKKDQYESILEGNYNEDLGI